MNSSVKNCPCGKPQPYITCCGLYIEEGQYPQTPEQLMRSRYTAFTQGNSDYIKSTMCGELLKQHDPESFKQWTLSVQWDRLEVIAASPIYESTSIAFVQFIAHYYEHNKAQKIAELSEFKKIEGRWYYTNTAKLGRNDPCFCGSEKKYKKCCAKLI